MRTTTTSPLTLGAPLNIGSVFFAGLGIILSFALIFPYAATLQEMNKHMEIPHWIAWHPNAENVLILCAIIISTYAIGILTRIGIIFGSMQFKPKLIKISYIIILLEIFTTMGCAIGILYTGSSTAPPIITIVASVIQLYFVVVFAKTENAVSESNTRIRTVVFPPDLPTTAYEEDVYRPARVDYNV